MICDRVLIISLNFTDWGIWIRLSWFWNFEVLNPLLEVAATAACNREDDVECCSLLLPQLNGAVLKLRLFFSMRLRCSCRRLNDFEASGHKKSRAKHKFFTNMLGITCWLRQMCYWRNVRRLPWSDSTWYWSKHWILNIVSLSGEEECWSWNQASNTSKVTVCTRTVRALHNRQSVLGTYGRYVGASKPV